MTRDRLDERIDSVACDLTAGAPRSDFRTRVLSRLETRGPRPLWWRPIAIVPIAAMITIAAAVGIRESLVRVNHTTSNVEPRTEASVQSSQPGAESVPLRPVISSAGTPDQVTSTAPSRIAQRAASAEPTDTDTMDELAPPPLEVMPIPMDGIATSRLELPALTMPTIAMAPLEFDDHPEPE